MLQHATFIMFLRSTTTDLNDFSGGVLTEGDGSSKCCTVSKRLLQDKQDATHEETTQKSLGRVENKKIQLYSVARSPLLALRGVSNDGGYSNSESTTDSYTGNTTLTLLWKKKPATRF